MEKWGVAEAGWLCLVQRQQTKSPSSLPLPAAAAAAAAAAIAVAEYDAAAAADCSTPQINAEAMAAFVDGGGVPLDKYKRAAARVPLPLKFEDAAQVGSV